MNRLLADKKGRTELHHACIEGKVGLAEFLLSSGWDVDAQDHFGNHPMNYAMQHGHSSIVELLTRAGGSLSPKNRLGMALDSRAWGCCSAKRGIGAEGGGSSSEAPLPSHRPPRLAKMVTAPDFSEAMRAATTAGQPDDNDDLDLWMTNDSLNSPPSRGHLSTRPSHIQSQHSSLRCPQTAAPSHRDTWWRVDPKDLSMGAESERNVNSAQSEMLSVSSSNTSFSRSMKIATYIAPLATIMFIDIQGFTAKCASMSAAEVGSWVSDFYEKVDVAAHPHGVRKVEARGDCCVCLTGDACGTADDQVVRILAFAARLDSSLRVSGNTYARMGIATGSVTFLTSDGFASVLGNTVDTAERMESLSSPGTVMVPRSSAERWAQETGCPAPQTLCVQGKGMDPERVAVFHCALGTFRAVGSATAASSSPLLRPQANPTRARRARSV